MESTTQHVGKASVELRLSVVMSVVVVVLAALTGYLGYRFHQAQLASSERELFVQTGRQAAINLTTISYTQVDADVARILDSAVGTFHDDFQSRAQPFIDVVKAAQSTTEGSVTAAGLESINGDRAQVIVAVSVRTSTADSSEHQPKAWRMRMSLQRIGDSAKVSDVQFVP
jgi:Mce-associated membrane protein